MFLSILNTFSCIDFCFIFFAGYYQPAGPLISSHLLQQQQQQPPPAKTIPPPLDSDPLHQPPTSSSAGPSDGSDNEVLITG